MFTLQASKEHAVAFKPSHFTCGKDGAPSEVFPPLTADADKGDQDAVVAVAYRTTGNRGVMETGDKTAALNCATDVNQNIIAFQQNTRDEVRAIGGDGQIAGALAAQAGMKQQNYIAFTQNQVGDVCVGDVCAAMGTNQNATGRNTPKVHSGMMVRRLTPIECARLQSHPDSWAVEGVQADGVVVQQSDSAQYRQYGNGVTVNVLEWIARRIKPFLA